MASHEKGFSPRRDTAAVDTIETRLLSAGTGGVQAKYSKLGNSRSDIKPRPTAGISEIFVMSIFSCNRKHSGSHYEKCEAVSQAKVVNLKIRGL